MHHIPRTADSLKMAGPLHQAVNFRGLLPPLLRSPCNNAYRHHDPHAPQNPHVLQARCPASSTTPLAGRPGSALGHKTPAPSRNPPVAAAASSAAAPGPEDIAGGLPMQPSVTSPASSAAAAAGSFLATADSSSDAEAPDPAAAAALPPTLIGRMKDWFSGDKYKAKLAGLGMAAFLSYGFVSNVTYGACLTFSWVTFVKQKGISPLASGQWPVFLAFYAGIWAVQNIFRPARFALAIAMAPLYDRLLDWIAARTGFDKKIAFGIVLFCMGMCTSTLLFSAIYLLGGLPDGLGPFPPLKRF